MGMVDGDGSRMRGGGAPGLDGAAVTELVTAVRSHAATLGAAAVAANGRPPHDAPYAEDDAALVDLISSLSTLVAAAEALAARSAVELDRVRRAQEAEQEVPAARRGAGVGAEVGLARRESGYRGRSFVGFGKVLCTEMPHTLARLAAGDLSPWRAVLLVKESACLSREDRERLDEDLCADPAVLAGLGDRAVAAAARAWACREDPASLAQRRSQAAAERRVSLRPAPDTMAYLTALLPVAEGVAVLAALAKHADAARASGDDRTRGQVMADGLVARVTGREECAAPPVLVNLVMTDTALFSGDDEPAHLPGYGPVPAAMARELVGQVAGGSTGSWVRRLYVAPGSGDLVAMDSRRRKVPRALAEMVRLRDGGTCRVPWCDAPARHIDHVVGVAAGGRTRLRDLQGTCEAHNYAKQCAGWHADTLGADSGIARDPGTARGASPPGRHTVVTRTPSGHRYVSTAPRLPGVESTAPVGCTASVGFTARAATAVPIDWSDGERAVVIRLGWAA